ncbi:hypothetical protein ACROYT_G031359 [Oculina patagonica]
MALIREMATKMRIALVTFLLLFIVMEQARPILAGKGKFKKLQARVEELEKTMKQMDECESKYITANECQCYANEDSSLYKMASALVIMLNFDTS